MKRKPITKLLIIIDPFVLMICILLFFANNTLNLPDVLASAVSHWTGNSAAGEEAKVRLIGIDTPESVASSKYLEQTGKENTREGEKAAKICVALTSGG